MAIPAEEMPITAARDDLANVVNRAHYGREVTHLTRRGRRLAAIVPEELLDLADARALEEATANVCRALWQEVKDCPDEKVRQSTKDLIDRLMDAAEDQADGAAADAALAEIEAGVPLIPLDEVKAELGL